MSARRSAYGSASNKGGDSNNCCYNNNQGWHNNTHSCSCQPTYCLPYPEFALSTTGICYIQCNFCCQMYPCCCTECPHCGGRQSKPSKEVQIPEIAFCPCCCQESPKANGLQNLCKPNPCCMRQCTCAERELIAQCLLGSFRQARGKRCKSCCKCQPEGLEEGSKGTNDRAKNVWCHYPAYKSTVLCTCESDKDAVDNSRPKHTEKCICERRKTSERHSEPYSCPNHRQTQQRQSRGSRGRRQSYGDYPSVARGPCGCEVEIRNITYNLPVCRLDDEDDDNCCCCCNK